ncbi:MPH1 ATP-dependent DNA helicase MPH1 [Candida maltosa Xu316]|uniref:ATP-dependent DNA helicase n=1 Tax=Candida maltosa (strain Xu316) TaxID=1245528 RepID=M3JVX7_CANMX|nr:hypothetical protein G210_2645 [Candida maltosa Xu316]
MDEDDDWILEDEDDPEFQAILHGNQDTTNQTLPQRTLTGGFAPSTKDQYEEIPIPKKINLPTHHVMDFQNLQTYIYPINFEVRDYQFNIVYRAFFDNVLVALPTGLGKTFIASTVMLNFLRWFPNSRIVFMAPTRPLVAQQIKACCSIAGIPSSKVAIFLDKTRKNRAEIWESKQVFFTTPQVVENDLASGLVDPKSISLLVIDEAHRAKGNYAYNKVVTFMNRFNQSYRILALTATPAADIDGVQMIVDNLGISKIEVRTEQSIDTIKYMKRKSIVRRTLQPSDEIKEIIDLLATAIKPVLDTANERGLMDLTDATRINFFQCNELSRKITRDPTISEGLKWSNFFLLQLLGTVGQCYRRLNIYGINSFYAYFHEKFTEFKTKWNASKSKNKLNADFYFSDEITEMMDKAEKMIEEMEYSHPKIETIVEELDDFFNHHQTADSKVIIFTEFRDSALEIVQTIEKASSKGKPHIFIGQAKEKEKFDEVNFGKKKVKGQKKSKNKEADERPSTRSSSENAQLNGMSQKVQKEIIKKFKQGTYNILVATSIGEEGLDIGEVDLIICYDSTSSPIKNVQRMGRTGRKRDGKVLLLFSSNEESKFDKAMGGYEFIQQRIMQGGMLQLHPQNRIIPEMYTPEVVKKLIEIPEENIEIKAEDDEDEIIKIATSYMLGGKPKKGKKKQTKKFFMPDDVETGFKSVAEMVRKVGETKSLAETRREKTLLDTFMHSDSEHSDFDASQKNGKLLQRKNTSVNIDLTEDMEDTVKSGVNSSLTIELSDDDDNENSPLNQTTKSNITNRKEQPKAVPVPSVESATKTSHSTANSDIIDGLDDDFSFSSEEEKETNQPAIEPIDVEKPKKKSLGVKRRLIVSDEVPLSKISKTNPLESVPVDEVSISTIKPMTPSSSSDMEEKPLSTMVKQTQTQPKKSLGVKRAPHPVNILDQLKTQAKSSTKIMTNDSDSPNPIQDHNSISAEPHSLTSLDSDNDDDDIFNDGLDETIAHINTNSLPKDHIPEEVYQFSTDPEDGFLTNSQSKELHTYYFTTIDPIEETHFYDPAEGVSKNKESGKFKAQQGGQIPHSTATERLLNAFNTENYLEPKALQNGDADYDFSFIVNE